MSRELTKSTTSLTLPEWRSNWPARMREVSEKVTKDTSFSELWKMDTPSVSLLNLGETSTENGVTVFRAMVKNIVVFLGAEWSADQIRDCGKICFDEAHYLTFAELSHFAKKAKAGGFEKVYGKFTPATFMDWFTQYCNQNFEDRTGYFAGVDKKPTTIVDFGLETQRVVEWTEPENPVSDKLVHQLVTEVTEWYASEQDADTADREAEIKKQQDKIIAYNKMLTEQAVKSGKMRTAAQVPDQCENEIPK